MTQALTVSDDLSRRLERLDGTFLRRHSTFAASANFLAADGHLVTFLSAVRPMAPSSVRLPWTNLERELGSDDALRLRGGRIQGRTLDIELAGAASFQPELRAVGSDRLTTAFLERIHGILLSRIPAGGIAAALAASLQLETPPPEHHLPPRKVVQRLNAFVGELRSPGWSDSMPDLVHGLIGYGIGLTPAADDFLAGILAASTDWDRRFDPLAAACLANRSRTTGISSEMLFHAGHHRFSETIVQLLGMPDPGQSMTKLLNHGHSSGHDMLCGIYAGLLARASLL